MTEISAERRHVLTQRLGRLMAEVSEACYCAGWLGGTEYSVPELCRRAIESGSRQPWGQGDVTPDQALRLAKIADELGHWADLDEPGVGYEPFAPFPIPAELTAELDRERTLSEMRAATTYKTK